MAADESNVHVQAADASKNGLCNPEDEDKALDMRDSQPYTPSKASVYTVRPFACILLLKTKGAFRKYCG